MKKFEPVSHIMTKHLIVLNPNDGLSKAEELFKKHKVRHLPVVSGDKVVGIVSMTDLARISFVDSYNPDDSSVDPNVYSFFTLDQIMIRNPKCVYSNTSIKEVAQTFIESEFHALPVVEKDRLVGIVTTTDLIKYLLEQY